MLAILEKTRKELLFDQVSYFAQEGNFTKDNFHEMDILLSEIHGEIKNGTITKDDILKLRCCFDQEFLKNTIHGHGLLKPNGYAGDYLLLDKIYTRYVSNEKKYRAWDEYFQQHAAPRAVRNRKEYFKNLVKKRAGQQDDLKILDVVSGSARELYELHHSMPNNNINTTCVELDVEAITFAKKLNKVFLHKIDFVHSNIFRFRNAATYDLIWSAGLFDYLNDKAFVMLLKRFKSWLNPGGEIIIGNYSKLYNPSRNYMEIFGDWFLIHRSASELASLALQAGFELSQLQIGRENENVILFLHAKNG